MRKDTWPPGGMTMPMVKGSGTWELEPVNAVALTSVGPAISVHALAFSSFPALDPANVKISTGVTPSESKACQRARRREALISKSSIGRGS